LHLFSLIDGGWFDIATVLVALLLSILKCIRHGYSFISGETGRNILHGIAIFPLFMLAISVFSNEALQSLLSSNKIILSVAGFVALFSILEDEFERPFL
jgi:F0F1-type ATP synthase assembly protein I